MHILNGIYTNSTVRDYVTEFEGILDSSDNIYKGEEDDEDLSKLTDSTIWGKLKDRIYDSSTTVVFISPGMKKEGTKDRDQWIPWEVSYSLKEESRKNKSGNAVTSRTNAMVAVVLPDINGSYSYYFESKSCCLSGCTTCYTKKLFQVIRDNMFNRREPDIKNCDQGTKIWYGSHSYIAAVKWSSFKSSYGSYIDEACERQDNIDDYTIVKSIT